MTPPEKESDSTFDVLLVNDMTPTFTVQLNRFKSTLNQSKYICCPVCHNF